MARIRTVKPGLFRHEDLFELERKTNLPIRVAWIGLFTVADRKGRFEWKPNILKLDILPWDDLDFSLVLEALKESQFIKQYEVNGKQFGFIPTWGDHQKPHHSEPESRLPDPDIFFPPALHGEHPVSSPSEDGDSPSQTSQEKEEEKEKEKEKKTLVPVFDFLGIYQEYPRKDGKQEGLRHCKAQIKSPETYYQVLSAVRRYRAQCEREGTEKKFIKHFSSFMHGGKWRDWLDSDVGTSTVISKSLSNRAEVRSEGNRSVLHEYLNRIGGENGSKS